MKIIIAFLLLVSMVSMCIAQSPDPTLQDCTYKDKICPVWLHKLIGPYPVEDNKIHYPKYKEYHKDNFFSFRTYNDPILHPDKKSWVIFIGSHALAWTSLVITNHNKEAWHSEAPALGAITGLDLIMFKCVSPSFSIEASTYSTIHYLRSR